MSCRDNRETHVLYPTSARRKIPVFDGVGRDARGIPPLFGAVFHVFVS
jgi:hypothetical protein